MQHTIMETIRARNLRDDIAKQEDLIEQFLGQAVLYEERGLPNAAAVRFNAAVRAETRNHIARNVLAKLGEQT